MGGPLFGNEEVAFFRLGDTSSGTMFQNVRRMFRLELLNICYKT